MWNTTVLLLLQYSSPSCSQNLISSGKIMGFCASFDSC